MSDLTKQVDELFINWDKTTSPGCALAIIQDGKTVYKRGYGMASLELNVPITPSSVFYLASVSKQFTAMAVALLIEEEKINLADDIRQYLPELPDYHANLAIEHLLRHTSGIRDYLELGRLAGKKLEDVWTENEMLKMIVRQAELNFLPGDRYVYSNSGYVLLSIIVKRITGKSLRAFANEHIFQPLGMEHTVFKEDHKQIIPNRVSGYSRPPSGGFVNEFHNLQLVGDGGLYSSVEDLLLWDQNFYHNKLGKGTQTLIDLMHSTAPLNDGTALTYALGLVYDRYRGLKIVEHGGGLNGARTQMIRYPDQNFTVICLSNLGDFNPEEMIAKIADLYLASDFQSTEEDTSAEPIALSGQDLASKVGLYRNVQTGITRRVKLQHDQLVIPLTSKFTLTLLPLTKNRFKLAEFPGEVIFESTEPGDGLQMSVVSGSLPAGVYASIVAASPTIDGLNAYCGKYHSHELDADYFVAIENEQLVLRHGQMEDNELQPTISDGFCGNDTEIVFIRGDGNAVLGFALSTPRIRNVRFIRA